MKIKTLIFIILLLIPSLSLAKMGTVEANLGYFSPVFEEAFQEIYGGGWTYGGDLTFDVWKGLGIWAGVDFFSKTGELTFTKEETQLALTSFVVGAQYTFFQSPVSFFAGLGTRVVLYKESNVLGEPKKTGIGLEAKVGAYKKLIAGLFVEVFVGLSTCVMQPQDFKINVGGLEAGIGLGYEF